MLDYPNQDKQLLFSTLINRVDLDLKTNKGRINLSPFEGIILK